MTTPRNPADQERRYDDLSSLAFDHLRARLGAAQHNGNLDAPRYMPAGSTHATTIGERIVGGDMAVLTMWIRP